MYEFYVTIVGAAQGRFHGETTQEPHLGKLVGLSYDQPGAATDTAGRGRQARAGFEPVRFTKQWGAASPQLLQALVTAEELRTVVFEFIGTNEAGEQSVFHRVTLFGARVVSLRPFIDLDAEPSSLMPLPPLEEVGLSFEGLRVENLAHRTMAEAGTVPKAKAAAPKPRKPATGRARR